MKPILIITFLIFLLAQPSRSGQIKTWTDEEGVTHIELEGFDTRKTQVNKPDRSKELEKLKEEQQQKIRQLNIEHRKEREEIEKELEKNSRAREIERAKKDYEFLKENESRYRRNYHEARTREDKEYWYNKMEEVREAHSKYLQLLNQ